MARLKDEKRGVEVYEFSLSMNSDGLIVGVPTTENQVKTLRMFESLSPPSRTQYPGPIRRRVPFYLKRERGTRRGWSCVAHTRVHGESPSRLLSAGERVSFYYRVAGRRGGGGGVCKIQSTGRSMRS